MGVELTFVFADLAGYTALTEAHGDDDAAQVATRFHELARACLPAGTRLVKTIGDAVMVVAPTIESGIRAAFAIARSVAAQPAFPALRVGLHAGPVVERGDDFFGATVNVAARVSGIARVGEIVCTARIAGIATAEGLAMARPMGTVRLKNVAEPVALYALNAGDIVSELRHVDPVCRMQIVPDEAPARTSHEGTMLYFCSLGCAAKFDEAPEAYLPLALERPTS